MDHETVVAYLDVSASQRQPSVTRQACARCTGRTS